ncbi:inactive rhomboid protein 1-like isoform X1 [Oculina patagonica]
MVHLSMLIWSCWIATFADIGLAPIVNQRIEPVSFRGNITVTYTQRPNPLIGPTGTYLVFLGALFPPCMREDHALNVYQVKALYPRLGGSGERLGCCEVPKLNIAGTTTELECRTLSNDTAQWRGTQCSQRSASQSTVQHILRPCCGELDGQCTLTSPEHCWFMNGRFHMNAEHCTQVDCLQQLCILGDQAVADNYVTQFSPRRSNQWWRLVTSVYLHQGILDCLVITCLQIWLYWGQENSIGWLRMAIVHHTAGVGGHLIGSLFTRHASPQAGAGPAVGGIMGLALFEHVILWCTVKNRVRRLALLICCLFVLFFIGTIPQVNNYSMLTGLFYGFLCALVFWSSIIIRRKLLLFQFIIIFVTVTMFLFSFALFYGVQHIGSTSRDINCIPYTEGLCD